MTIYTFEQLTTPLTKDQVSLSIYNVLATIGVNTTSWKSGSPMRTLITGCSIIIAAAFSLMALISRSGFLELSTGSWLTWVAYYMYGVTRITEDFAEGTFYYTNSGGGVYSLDPDDLVVSNPVSGKTYRNTDVVSILAMSSGSFTIRAIEAGSLSTSAAGAISKLETTLLGVSGSNTTALVGRDAELDPELRLRCSEKLGSLSPNGPWDAYAYAARNALRADGSSIGITRVRIFKDGYGNVTIYCATASGGITGDPDDVTTDIGKVNDDIQRKSTPLCVTADAQSASELVIAISYTIWMTNNSGLTEDQIKETIATKLAVYMSGAPIGGNIVDGDDGKIFVDTIRSQITTAIPQIFKCVLSIPALDQVLSIDQVPVLGVVTAVAINQVAPSEGWA